MGLFPWHILATISLQKSMPYPTKSQTNDYILYVSAYEILMRIVCMQSSVSLCNLLFVVIFVVIAPSICTTQRLELVLFLFWHCSLFWLYSLWYRADSINRNWTTLTTLECSWPGWKVSCTIRCAQMYIASHIVYIKLYRTTK